MSILAVAATVHAVLSAPQEPTADPLRDLQQASIADRETAMRRVYAYGWQGLDGVFSTHRTHSNRPVLAMSFGAHCDFEGVTGPASPYRDELGLARIYGQSPPRTVDPRQAHGDQTQVHDLLLAAADAGVRRLIVMVMDGGDWQTYAAASVVKSGVWDPEGPGRGLAFFDYVPPGTGVARPRRSYASLVTSPLRDGRLPGGFDVALGGRFPWSAQDHDYLAGSYRTEVVQGRPVPRFDAATAHATADSASTATAIFSGRKTLNGRVNVGPDGERYLPLGRRLQNRGWTIATVTDVPFDHATPASVYASVASRSRYPEIARQMLGLAEFRGVDVALGYGFEFGSTRYIDPVDVEALRGRPEWRWVEGSKSGLTDAAREVGAARAAGRSEGSRLFGLFGNQRFDHAPFRTADGRYDPTDSLSYANGAVEPAPEYTPDERAQLPTLQDLTAAALAVLDATPEQPFLLLVEAGQVDWSSHYNNLDHAVGEVLSAEQSFLQLTDWITEHEAWNDTLLVVTSDHGHLLQVDLPALRAAVHGDRAGD